MTKRVLSELPISELPIAELPIAEDEKLSYFYHLKGSQCWYDYEINDKLYSANLVANCNMEEMERFAPDLKGKLTLIISAPVAKFLRQWTELM